MPLDPEVAMMLGLVRRADRAPYWSMTPAAARTAVQRASRVLDIATRKLPRVDDYRITARDGAEIPIRLYVPVDAVVLPALLYFHGGGFTVGGIATHDALCRMLADEARCVVASVDYRLAPEHRFPIAVHDAQDAMQWLARHADDLELDPARLAVGGDSAGGTLAAVAAIDARDRSIPLCLQLLLYPGTKRDTDTPSHRAFAEGYILDARTYHWFMDQYAPDMALRDDWRFAPLDGAGPGGGPVSLAGVAPAVVVVAGFDPVHDEGVAYADRLAAAGVAVQTLDYPGMIHGFLQFGGMITVARSAHRDIVRALDRAFRPAAADASRPIGETP